MHGTCLADRHASVGPFTSETMTKTLDRLRAIWNRRSLILAVACLSVLVLASPLAAAPAYPVKVGPTGRYLVDQNGVPFLIVGESPQAMIGAHDGSSVELLRKKLSSTVWR